MPILRMEPNLTAFSFDLFLHEMYFVLGFVNARHHRHFRHIPSADLLAMICIFVLSMQSNQDEHQPN